MSSALITVAQKKKSPPDHLVQFLKLAKFDDPNLIYPYKELELYKPKSEIAEVQYDYIIHEVQPGESLWSIARQEYNDPIAWSLIFWDNDEMLTANGGMLKPGMELRIRTRLW